MNGYTLVRSQRKTLAIHIMPDGSVEVRAPLRLPKPEIEAFVAEKARWIEQAQRRIADRRSSVPRELPPLIYDKGEFGRIARALVTEWEQRLKVKADFLGLRKMTSRWGSCTSRTRRIRLNSALAYCRRECLEYVVVHELAHLRENNHSKRFWAIVEGALPDYKSRRKELRDMQWVLKSQRENDREKMFG